MRVGKGHNRGYAYNSGYTPSRRCLRRLLNAG